MRLSGKPECTIGENVSSDFTFTEDQLEEIKNCDGAIFTSGSNANSIYKAGINMPENIISIGPSCSEVLHNHGVEYLTEAQVASYKGIHDMLLSIS